MNTQIFQACGLLAAGLATSLLLTRVMIHLGPKLGLMDQPDERRVHLKPIPRAGGIAVWISFLAVSWAGRLLFPDLFAGDLAGNLPAFTLSSALLLVVGVLDDRGGMQPLVKLAGQINAAILYYLLSPDSMQTSIFGFSIPMMMASLVFIGWCVLLINAFNLIDGLDGLCSGLVAISLFVIACLELIHGHTADALFVLVMLAAVAGFMRFNLNPAKIFLGDAGSMLLGFFLATAATQAGGRRALIGSIMLPIAIAGVPLLDVVLAIWRRSAKNQLNRWSGGRKVGVFSPDKDHLHHRFLARGINQKKVALILQCLAGVLAALAFVPMFLGGKGLAVTVCGLFLLGLFGLRHLAQVELRESGSLIHLAIKRRSGTSRIRIFYFLYDIACLAISAIMAVLIESGLGSRVLQLEQLARFVVAFIACQMVVLHVLRVYRRVWSRATLGEFVLVGLGLLAGGAAAGAICQTVTGETVWSITRLSIIAIGSSSWLVLIPRAVPELVRELAIESSHRHLTKRKNSGSQLLVYGAGDMGNLFVKYLKTCTPQEFQRFQISGFLDDNPALKGRTINGFRILGGLDAIDEISGEYPIHGILLAMRKISDERRQQILNEAERLGLTVYLWAPELQPIRVFHSAPARNENPAKGMESPGLLGAPHPSHS